MHIPQVNQHQQVHSSTEPKHPERNLDLSESFEGRLILAEQPTDLFSNDRLDPDSRREYDEAIEEKRRSENLEKTVELKYWNDQKLADQIEKNDLSRSFGLELKHHEMADRTFANRKAEEGVLHKKALNSELGHERILAKKPHLINPTFHQDSQQGQEKAGFQDLLQVGKETSNKAQLAGFTASNAVDMHSNPDVQQNVAISFAEKLNRPNNTVKPGSENFTDFRLKNKVAPKTNSDQSTPFNVKKENSEAKDIGVTRTNVNGKHNSNDFNQIARESQKTETNQAAKEVVAQKSSQTNIKEVIDNIKVLLSSGKDTIVVRLAPEHLGKLEIKLKKSNGGLSGELKVENQEARDLLQSGLTHLKQGLEIQGFKLDSFSVYVKGENPALPKQAQNKSAARKTDGKRGLGQPAVTSSSLNNTNSNIKILV